MFDYERAICRRARTLDIQRHFIHGIRSYGGMGRVMSFCVCRASSHAKAIQNSATSYISCVTTSTQPAPSSDVFFHHPTFNNDLSNGDGNRWCHLLVMRLHDWLDG